jgi:hypothetical protein
MEVRRQVLGMRGKTETNGWGLMIAEVKMQAPIVYPGPDGPCHTHCFSSSSSSSFSSSSLIQSMQPARSTNSDEDDEDDGEYIPPTDTHG